MPAKQGFAIVTPSFERDFELCRELNESVLTFAPEATHYIIVDATDLRQFGQLTNSRTVIAAVEDVVPRGYFKVPFSKKWWFSSRALYPAKGWLVQQLVKLCSYRIASEALLVNVDSDVRFVRTVTRDLFIRDGRTRLYRLPGGVQEGMEHVKWQRTVARLLGISPEGLPKDDYVGNVISWDREIVRGLLDHIERTTGEPWHVAYARARSVSEYLAYGLYVDRVLEPQKAGVWIDEHPRCHTYWGPGPLPLSAVEGFTSSMGVEDVAFSIAGYTRTPAAITQAATRLALRIAAG